MPRVQHGRRSARRFFLFATTIVATAFLLAPTGLAWAGSTCDDLAGFPGDLDGDGFAGPTQGGVDCNDGDPGLWSTPGVVQDLVETTGSPSGAAHTFIWTDINTHDPGTTGLVVYDALRSGNAADYSGPTALCLDPSGNDLQFSDVDVPAPGQAFFYQVRANNACGDGTLGAGNLRGAPVPRVGLTCDCSVLCDDGDTCTRDTCNNGSCSTSLIDPELHRPPLAATACGGGDVVFDVEASGAGSLTYEWFKNGAPVGLNLPTVMFTGVSPGDDGAAITVRITDGCSSVVSPPAVLTVLADPASCSGGLDGQEPPNNAHRGGDDMVLTVQGLHGKGAPPRRGGLEQTDDWTVGRFAGIGGEDNIADDFGDYLQDDIIDGGNAPPGGGEIDVLSWSWGINRSGSGVPDPRDAASGMPSGKRQHKPVNAGSGSDTDTMWETVSSGNAGSGSDTDTMWETVSGGRGPKPTRVMALDSGNILRASDPCGGSGGGGGSSGMPTGMRLHDPCGGMASGKRGQESGGGGPPRAERYSGEVLPHSGEYVYRSMDIFIPGRMYPFTFARTYRSREERNGRMGFQWVDNQDRRVEWENPASPLNLRLHDGSSARIDLYAPDPVGCYDSPGFFRQICPDPSPAGGFILSFADKRRWFFHPLDGTPIAGRIQRVEDRNGNTQLYTYDSGNGRLLTITDTLNRNVDFGYDANGRITTVTDFTGRVWSYAYSAAGDLVSFTTPAVTGTLTGNDFPAGKTTTYSYSENRPLAELNHNLQTVTDPSGENFLRVLYTQAVSPSDARFDRVDRLLLSPSGAPLGPPASSTTGAISYVYVAETPAAANNFAVSKTIIGDRMGNVEEAFFDSQGRGVMTRRYTGRAPDPDLPVGQVSNRPVNPLRPTDPSFYTTRSDYNADSLPIQVTHPNGNQMQVTYDSSNPNPRLQGNILLVRLLPGALGGAQAQIDYQWSYATDFSTEYCNGLDGECSRGNDADTFIPGGVPFRDGGEIPMTRGAGVTGVYSEKASYGGKKGYDHYLAAGRGAAPRAGSIEAPDLVFGTGAGGTFSTSPSGFTDPEGNTLTLTYDPFGNLQTLTAPPVTQAGGLPSKTVVWQWGHNASGQVTQRTTPAGRVDTVSYHATGPQTGYPETFTVDSTGLALASTATYDAVGNLVGITDPKGAATTYDYNSLDQIVRTVSRPPFLNETYVYYDASDRIVRVDVRDNVGLASLPQPYVSTHYEYDALRRARKERHEADEAKQACVITDYDHDANDFLAEVRRGEATSGNQPTNTVSFFHDERNLLFQEELAGGDAVQVNNVYAYDGNANLVDVAQGLQDPAGPHQTTFTYDGYNRLIAINDAEGNVSTHGYDPRGNLISVRLDGELEEGVSGANIRLAEASCVHDELGYVIVCQTDHFITDTGTPVGSGFETYSYVYTQDLRLSLYIDHTGDTTVYDYDTARRISRVTDPLGNQVDYVYDANSNITRVTHLEQPTAVGGGSQSTNIDFEYDELDRMAATEDHVGNRATMSYDDRNNRVQATDALGNEMRCTYDGLSRRVRCERDLTDTGTGAGTVLDVLTRTVTYDDSHRPVSATDPAGNVTTYEYDAINRITRRVDGDGTQHTFVWDVHHELGQRQDANGTLVTYTRDRLNRKTGVSVLPGTGVIGTTAETWTYDGLGRPVTITDDDTQVVLAYDSHSNIISESTRVDALTPQVSTGTFDNEGRLTQVFFPSGRRLTYNYDALDRVSAVLEPGRGTVATFDYLGPGRVSLMVSGNGVRNETDWDFLRRITSTRQVGPGAAAPVLAHHTYQYDDMYNKSERLDQLPGGEFQHFTYDSAYRMVESERGAPGGSSSSIVYTLDVSGNRTLVTGGPAPGAYVLDAGIPPGDAQVHQYSDTPFGPRLYDENGNLSSRTEPAGTRLLGFDYQNRLARTELTGALSREYVYDALGRRLARREGQVQPLSLVARWDYYHCASSDCAPIQHQEGGLNSYVHQLPGRGPLIQLRDVTGADLYVHTDDLGSTLLLTDGAGAIVERADYDDHGEPSFFDAAGTPLAGPATVNPYYFRGSRLMEEEGLSYLFGGVYMDRGCDCILTDVKANPPQMARLARSPRPYAGGNPWSMGRARGGGMVSEMMQANMEFLAAPWLLQNAVNSQSQTNQMLGGVKGNGNGNGNGEFKVVINSKK